ncbi:hypothetical protein AVEN_221789-1 [Araneus ventricosus]|uniref:Uncharacterized protein n=1 Tax=Araneus ventricosus TaxID=182803 RepID=A0A4Y2R0D7_ARAVE|nr:hypothetical protein AVEN_221789-1 [Araneus ventricosus]
MTDLTLKLLLQTVAVDRKHGRGMSDGQGILDRHFRLRKETGSGFESQGMSGIGKECTHFLSGKAADFHTCTPCGTYNLLLAMFYNIFDTVPERPVDNTDNLYSVLDGGSLIHRVVWPKQETFGDVYTTYLSYIKRHYGDEVTVVFDGYTESSVNTKVIERQRRRIKRTSREIIFNESIVLLDPQRQFLSNLANKEFFISQTR